MMKYTGGMQFGAHIDGQPIKSVEGLIMVLKATKVFAGDRVKFLPIDIDDEIERVDDGVFIGSVARVLAKGGKWEFRPVNKLLTISVDLP